MKKVIFAAVVLFSMTTFAINPVSVNPIIKLEFEKTPTKEVSSEKEEANLTCKAMLWDVRCNSGSLVSFVYEGSYAEASSYASTACGSGGWQMEGH
jgi:hypothetical protein